MRIFALIFAICLSLHASNLLTYNIYERTDRIDIMLSFDSPYEGNIFQKYENDMTMLIFNGLSFDQSANKSINSKILQEIYIEPKQNSVLLFLKSSSAINATASKTTDGFGIRIRVVKSASGTSNATKRLEGVRVENEAIATSQQSMIDTRYYMVVGVLIAMFLLLWLLKRKISKAQSPKNRNQGSLAKIGNMFFKPNAGEISVLYEKPIDRQNKVVLLSHLNKKYLVIVGSSNVLLDKFGEEKIESKDDFEVFFEENKLKLGQFLKERQTSLSAYKDKASKD